MILSHTRLNRRPETQIEFIRAVPVRQVVQKCFPSCKTPFKGGQGEINLDTQQVYLPTDTALQRGTGLGANKFVRSQIEKGQVYMDKSESHSIAAHDPASVSDKIFRSGGGKCAPCRYRPNDCHTRKADLADRFYAMIKRQRYNRQRAGQTSKDINFSTKTVEMWFVFAQSRLKQDGADNDGGYRAGNMSHQQKIIAPKPIFKKCRGKRFVGMQPFLEQKELEGNIQYKKRHDGANQNHWRNARDFVKKFISLIQQYAYHGAYDCIRKA